MKWVAKKSTKILVIALIAVLFLIGFAVVNHLRFMHEGNKKLDKMIAIADSFKAPEGWVLTDESQREPGNGLSCPTGGCPSVRKEWNIIPIASQEGIDQLNLVLANLTDDHKFNCDFDTGVGCLLVVEHDNFTLNFALRGAASNSYYDRLILRIE